MNNHDSENNKYDWLISALYKDLQNRKNKIYHIDNNYCWPLHKLNIIQLENLEKTSNLLSKLDPEYLNYLKKTYVFEVDGIVT
jgi:hypothetical protein